MIAWPASLDIGILLPTRPDGAAEEVGRIEEQVSLEDGPRQHLGLDKPPRLCVPTICLDSFHGFSLAQVVYQWHLVVRTTGMYMFSNGCEFL